MQTTRTRNTDTDKNSVKAALAGLLLSKRSRKGGQRHLLSDEEWHDITQAKQNGVFWEQIFDVLSRWTEEQGRAFYRDSKSMRQAYHRFKRNFRGPRT